MEVLEMLRNNDTNYLERLKEGVEEEEEEEEEEEDPFLKEARERGE